jgi:hypothetical protein
VRRCFWERWGHQGITRALEAVVAAFGRLVLGRKEAGRGPHGSERRGWRWAGPAGAQGPVGREASGWAWEKAGTHERRRGEWAG